MGICRLADRNVLALASAQNAPTCIEPDQDEIASLGRENPAQHLVVRERSWNVRIFFSAAQSGHSAVGQPRPLGLLPDGIALRREQSRRAEERSDFRHCGCPAGSAPPRLDVRRIAATRHYA
jgi:hypothetical protein